jgi:acyl carrier protein
VTRVWRVEGPFSAAALQQALNTVVARHEILRTTFLERDGRPIGFLQPDAVVPVDECQITPAGHDSFVESILRMPFDLSKAPLIRAAFAEVDPTEHLLAISSHHACFDLWSLPVLARELSVLYDAAVGRVVAELAALPIQYSDYAAWQREWLTSDERKIQLEYWQRCLEGLQDPGLAGDLPPPRRPTFEGRQVTFHLGPDIAKRISGLARRTHVTVFSSLLALFRVWLYARARTRDFPIGSPVANRNLAEIQDLIGLFVNTVVMRINLDTTDTFTSAVARAHEAVLGALAHQLLPFEEVVRALRPRRTTSTNPFFSVMFAVEGQDGDGSEFVLGEARCTPVPFASVTAKCDLVLVLTPASSGIEGLIEYSSDLFTDQAVSNFADEIVRVAALVLSEPNSTLEQLLPRLGASAPATPRISSAVTRMDDGLERVLPNGSASGSIEEVVAAIWSEHLRVPVGRQANFFEIGGDSLAAARLVAAINLACGTSLEPYALFENPTVAELAAVVADHRADPQPSSISRLPRKLRPIGSRHSGQAGSER